MVSDIAAFFLWTFVVAFLTFIGALVLTTPDTPDPGYGYKWVCEGKGESAVFEISDGGRVVVGKSCERVEK